MFGEHVAGPTPQLGELSSGRQALEGIALSKRSGSVGLIQLDEKMFGKNLRSSERGVAGGRARMTMDLERRWRCPRH